MKNLPVFLFLAAGIAIGMPALAQEASPPVKAAHKSAATKKTKAPKKSAAAIDEDDKTPDIKTSLPTEYNCELGNKLTIYRQSENDQQIALRWKKRLLRLNRVQTTTGANRFENRKNGWVWIDIPTKGMLLDAKKGHQLANECRSPEQMKPL